MRLTDDELRDVLARAEEIQRASRHYDEMHTELETVIGAAEVLSITTEGARVRFLRGSEHVVSLDQLRPCAFIPGERVVCNWPWWGPWTCTVVAYDAVKHRVKLSDGWGYTRTFRVAEVWLAAAPNAGATRARTRVYATLIGAGAGLVR